MKETVLEHLHRSVECSCGLQSPMSLENLRRSEWSDEFEQLMRNRLIMGAFRYGLIVDAKPKDRASIIQKLLDKYVETGNMEYLVDIANFAMMEYVCPGHPNAHWNPVDRKE